MPECSRESPPLSRAGFTGTKLDAVIVRGVNDDELADLIEFGRAHAAEVRFIEYMDVAGATHWSPERVVSRAEMLGGSNSATEKSRRPAKMQARGPAERFLLPDGTVFGIIASTTRSVLPHVQSQPPHGRRPMVSLPVRHVGHRPARPAARRRFELQNWPS
jgi:molybdenum cofactor biosynthesis enzyme MoaA